MAEKFLALIVPATIELGWLGILVDLFVLLVLFAMLLLLTAPFWGLGVIYWRWRRESRRMTDLSGQGTARSLLRRADPGSWKEYTYKPK